VVGGLGAALAVACADAGLTVRSTRLGIPQAFLAHASRPALLEQLGLTAQGCADAARALLDPA
jgi:1-deoxy-D-xylulose-5-phosphate synthase